jgi:hypothetical protein
VTDLFGATITDKDFEPLPKTIIRKAIGKYRYRKAENDWQRCSTCAHHFTRYTRAGHYFHKCELVGCSAGPGTDIRAGNVCDAWTGRDPY